MAISRRWIGIALVGTLSFSILTPPVPWWRGAAWLASWLDQRAEYHLRLEHYNTALLCWNLALALAPADPGLYLDRGRAWLQLYEWDRALADHDRAVALAPAWADAYFYRGVAYASILQTGADLHRAALADFHRYLALAPHGPHADAAARYAQSLQAALQSLSP